MLARIVRGDAVWVLRGQWVEFFCAGNDRALKARLLLDEEQLATDEEYKLVKELGAVSKHSCASKCLVVPARAAARAAGKFVPQTGMKWVELAVARLLWGGISAVPSTLPAEGEDDDDGVEDEASRDDADFEAFVDQDHSYAIADHGGVVAWQMQALERFATSPVQLDRLAGDIRLQSASTWENGIKGTIRRFLGFVASERTAQEVREMGLFAVLDGKGARPSKTPL